MAKTIAQKSVELAEANAELVAQVSALEAVKGDLTAKLEAAAQVIALRDEAIETATKNLEAEQAKTAEAEAKAQAIVEERDALSAKVKGLSATLALHPAVNQSNGQAAIKIDDEQVDPNGPQTWPQALEAVGGNYVAARMKFPKVFDAYIKANQNKPKGE
jgi:chromosome segregation ATPase